MLIASSPEAFNLDVSGSDDDSKSSETTKKAGVSSKATVPHTPRSRKHALDQRPGPAGNKTAKGAQDVNQFYVLENGRRYCILCR